MIRTDHVVMPEDHMEKLYASRNPIVRFVHTKRLREIAALCPKGSGLKVLDAGCGEGHLLHMLHRGWPGNDYWGIDITGVAIEKAKTRCPCGTFQIMDVSRLRFQAEFFDVIIITEVLEHIFEYQEVLAELKRVLKHGGVLIVTFPNEVLWTVGRFFLGRRPIKVPDHVNSFTPRKMKKAVPLAFVRQKNLPFPLPFLMALGSIMQFRK